MPPLTQPARSKLLAELSLPELQAELLKRWRSAPAKTLGEIYDSHEAIRDLAKGLYELADLRLKKLVRVWKKDKKAPVDELHVLDIEDSFRGAVKCFAPGFAHRYKLKLKKLIESE